MFFVTQMLHKKSVTWSQSDKQILYDTVEIVKIINNMEKKQIYFKNNGAWRNTTTYRKSIIGDIFKEYNFEFINNNNILKSDWFACKHKKYEELVSCVVCRTLKKELKKISPDKVKIFRLKNEIYEENISSLNEISNKDDSIMSYYGWTITINDNDVYINFNNKYIRIYKNTKK